MAPFLHHTLRILLFAYFLLAVSSSTYQRHLLQSSNDQNIQVFFPSISTPAFSNPRPPHPPPPPPFRAPELPSTSTPSSKSGDGRKTVKVIVATGASCFALSFVVFYLFHTYSLKKQRKRPVIMESHKRSFNRKESVHRGTVVDENGLDVLYWRNLVGTARSNHCNCMHDQSIGPQHVGVINTEPSHEYGRKTHETPLLPPNSVSSSVASESNRISSNSLQPAHRPPPLKAPEPPPPPPPPPTMKNNIAAPPPMPPRPPPNKSSFAAIPSTPPQTSSSGGPSRPPYLPSAPENGDRTQAKLKPLHWDKVAPPNAEHSMVWDKIGDGSFRIDDDLMDTLFSNKAQNNPKSTLPTAFTSAISTIPTRILLLDPRKSQNIAIIIRSLNISRREILNALSNGKGLSTDVLEKLSRITFTKEEESRILSFSDNVTKLADAESFLYHLLNSIQSPFERVNAMLFKSSYSSEIFHIKRSIQTLELACREIKSHGLFLKLLEAILKAGNRMNAGTSRGNAKGFDLAALCKLSDVKSTDGKTTLLHFVVEEVVRSEGKRLIINRNHSLRRSGSSASNNSNSGNLTISKITREEKEREYIKHGLPVVGGVSEELKNVKKAAAIDYDAHVSSCSLLGSRMGEMRRFLSFFESNDGFVKEMKRFLDAAEVELRMVVGEQMRVMEIVKKTTEYYQSGSSKDKDSQKLQLFVIVKDFFVIFDKVCVDITRDMQKKMVVNSGVDSSRIKEDIEKQMVARFPNLPPRFMSENSLKSSSSGSDSENEF